MMSCTVPERTHFVAAYNIYQMERKKPERPNYALPHNNSDYFNDPPAVSHPSHAQNLNDSLFFKYASSIIQVVAEDKLDSSCAGTSSRHPHNAIFEISEVKQFEGGGTGTFTQEQNNYNNIAAKMKKKGPNRKALTYNFSNLTLLCQKINRILSKPTKQSIETLKAHSINPDYNKTKKQIKRSSFYSGYTTSTSNQEKTSKRNSKRLTEERRREMHEEGANSIKGWIEYKILIFASLAFSTIKDHAARCMPAMSLRISEASTIRHEPLEKFYLTEYQHDNSMSITKGLPHNISESLVYTADQNFEFTQKDVTLTTPEKFGSEDRLGIPPMPTHMRKFTSNQESFVETYKPKEYFPTPQKPPIAKERIIPTICRPIRLGESQQRRYLAIRTNIYELPMLAAHELKFDRQRAIKDLTLLGDRFARNQPQTCQTVDPIVKELIEACLLLKPKASEKEYDLNRINEKKTYTSRKLDQKDREESKKVASSNQPAKEQKKDSYKAQNYYYFNQGTSPRTSKAIPFSPNLHPQKKQPLQHIKSVQSILKPTKNDKKTVRIQQSVVNEFTLDSRGKEALSPPPSSKAQAKQQQKKTQPFAYQSEAIQRKDQRVKSRSKINIMMQSPHKESPRVNIYHPIEPPKVQSKPILKNAQKGRFQSSPYGYPTEKSKSPQFSHNEQKNIQSPKFVSPPTSPQNIYQINPGMAYLNQTPNTPQRLVNQVKSNEQLKMQQQQQQRMEPIIRNSPGKVVSPNYLVNSQERKVSGIMGAPSNLRQEDKKSFYSPQVSKDAYLLQSPQRPMHHPLQQPSTLQTANVRRMYSEQQYFTKETSTPAHLRAINFNNNYYTSGPQTVRPLISQPNRNVFQQEQSVRKQVYMERPPSSKQSGERAALFANYSPMDSQLQYQQRSNNFSRNSSQLSRPKSMNQKIFITLRKDK